MPYECSHFSQAFSIFQPEAVSFGHLAVFGFCGLLHCLSVSAGTGIQSGVAARKLQDYNSQLHERLDAELPDSTVINHYIRHHALKDLRVTLIDLNGKVIYDSYSNHEEQMRNHADRPEVKKALREGSGFDVRRTSETTGMAYFYSASCFPNYIIRSALPYNVSLINNLKTDPHYLWFTVIITSLLIVIFYKFTNKLGTSISQLREFATTGRPQRTD